MKISFKKTSENTIKTDTLILPYYEDQPSDLYSELDELTGHLLKRVIDKKEFTGKTKQTTLIHIKGMDIDSILLVGLGKLSEVTGETIRQAGGQAMAFLSGKKTQDIALSTITFDLIEEKIDILLKPAHYFIEGALLRLYSFDKYKKKENNNEFTSMKILTDGKPIDLQTLELTVEATNFARDLVNTPSNDLTPTDLAESAKAISGKGIKVRILGKQQIEKEGMGAYLSVTRGSHEEPRFIILEYKKKREKPVVLIGKSITFDSGGISLKPSGGMEKMKYDMAGGAAVLGVFKAVAALDIPVNLIGLLPASDNMPGGSASQPGNVVKTVSGKTVEIINTDAEGRLVLADAIEYSIKKYKPRCIIDIATLTGACAVALGNEAIAMMGNNDDLMTALKRASDETFERVWQMPLYNEYKDYIKSDIADIKNTGGKSGSLVTAGYFLKEFAGDTPWAHLDIASTAWNDKVKPYLAKGATGIGVRLILQFLKGRV